MARTGSFLRVDDGGFCIVLGHHANKLDFGFHSNGWTETTVHR